MGWDRSPYQALYCVLRAGQAVGRAILEETLQLARSTPPYSSTASLGRRIDTSRSWYPACKVRGGTRQHLPRAAQPQADRPWKGWDVQLLAENLDRGVQERMRHPTPSSALLPPCLILPSLPQRLHCVSS